MTYLLQGVCCKGLIESADLHRRSEPRVQRASEELLRSGGRDRVDAADNETEAFHVAEL